MSAADNHKKKSRRGQLKQRTVLAPKATPMIRPTKRRKSKKSLSGMFFLMDQIRVKTTEKAPTSKRIREKVGASDIPLFYPKGGGMSNANKNRDAIPLPELHTCS